jgi:diketogulonate reductase-like aldo/keto reductase
MKYRQFAPTKQNVSVIGQGTWYLDEANHRRASEALDCGLELGMNHIDTAEMYGGGAAEELVGKAIVGRRDEVFLVSKVLPQNASRAKTIEACEQSLRRLETDRLDCYLLHWRGTVPLEETVAAFELLRADGKIRSWGVSNFDISDLEEILAIAGPDRIACDQVLYHLQERYAEHAVIPWCQENGVAVTAYSPFGHGAFPSPRSVGGRLLAGIARDHGATPRQVALAFLSRLPGVLAIPKASNAEHAQENAGGAELQLTDGEIARIDAAFPLGPRKATLPMI